MILVVNPGSSSIKFRLFDDQSVVVVEGIAERIGLDGRLKIEYQNQKLSFDCSMPDHETAVKLIDDKFQELKIISTPKDIAAIGFRIVHGGQKVTEPVIITQQVQTIIQDAAKLAPLHNPGALTAIQAFEKIFPTSKLVACFDTAFHQTMPLKNFLYSTPYEWYEKYEVRKFGFHGISYEYITQKMSVLLQKQVQDLNLIICHLGNGSSICLVKNGLSFDTTMGLTPLAGLMMGTRSGDIDPSILAYMSKQLNQDVFQITDVLNQQSGLKGVSQLSSDMRDIIQGMSQHQKLPTLAFEKYTNIIADFIVKFANELNLAEKLDGIIFTAGIGENSPEVRQAVIDRLPLLKLQLDAKKNTAAYVDTKLISSAKSSIPVYAVRTNEELMICQQTEILTKK